MTRLIIDASATHIREEVNGKLARIHCPLLGADGFAGWMQVKREVRVPILRQMLNKLARRIAAEQRLLHELFDDDDEFPAV